MTFDLSRVRFNARKDFLGVVMQQGRVQLDSDWNEWVAQLVRRIQAGTLDLLGPAVVPRETPDGFSIQAQGGKLTIGPGRAYVDGILAENHGPEPDPGAWNPAEAAKGWNRSLAEEVGTEAIDYDAQPYRPELQDGTDLPQDGTHLVYLDVWRREVSTLEEPELLEPALGVDTTGRLQTVWQVKILKDVGPVTCQTADEDISDWIEATRPSEGRLSTGTGDPPGDPGPCQVPPQAGYRGLENQLYRVEIHEGGALGKATFKWSRDNATVASVVSHINPSRDRLTVDSIGRDQFLRFNDGDWVEVTDDWRELRNLPGELRRIRTNGGVDENGRTLTLEKALTSGFFPVDGQNRTAPGRHTRVRRWDQAGKVHKENGDVYRDLDAESATGAITVPADGTRLFLEAGILVDFHVVEGPGGSEGEFRSGDHWVCAARSADGTVESLASAPPLGVHHHYARLAVVTFPDEEADCRVLWPPVQEGESCDCTVCVGAEAHNQGAATIQQAIDQVKEVGGTICLGAGTFRLRQALRITGARSIRIRGQGWRTVIQRDAPGPVAEIGQGMGVALENLTTIGSAVGGSLTPALSVSNVADLLLDHVNVVQLATGGATSAALAASGYLIECRVRDCVLVAERGVTSTTGKRDYLLTAELQASDNVLYCGRRGFSFEGIALHAGSSALSGNLILGCSEASVVTLGAVLEGSTFTVSGNVLFTGGTGVRAGLDGLRIERNEVTGTGGKSKDGVSLERGLDPVRVDGALVVGNRIRALGGHGVAIRHGIGRAVIKQNLIGEVGGAGLVMEENGSAESLVVENNEFSGLGGTFDAGSAFGALQLMVVRRLDVLNNLVEGITLGAQERVSSVFGLLAAGVQEARISGNRVRSFALGVRPPPTVGLRVLPLAHAAVSDNSVLRSGDEPSELEQADWRALWIGSEGRGGVEGSVFLGARFAYGVFEKQTFLLSAARVHFFARPDPVVSVRGNRLEGVLSAAPLVRVEGAESCIFSENQSRFTGTLTDEPQLAHLVARVVNASHNRLVGVRGPETLVMAIESGGAEGDRAAAVVLGNICSGRILVNGTDLGAPWKELNITA